MYTVDINQINHFLDKEIFEIFTISPILNVNVKVKLTNIRKYIYMGAEKPTFEYTLYILPSNDIADSYFSALGEIQGRELEINTSSDAYQDLRWVTNRKLEDFLKYFSINMNVMCTRVINNVKKTMNENLLREGKYDNIVRTIVKDIISIFKHQRDGEFGLPEDIRVDELTYKFPNLQTEFSIFLDLQLDPSIEGVDVDAEYYRDDDVIFITIISNPEAKYSILQELTSELNEIVRHELEHIKQHEQGYEFPREPKNPEKYYTQQHELDAQRAGFKRRAKGEKKDFETIVRQWFEKNQHKHKMNPQQAEKVIQKILQEK